MAGKRSKKSPSAESSSAASKTVKVNGEDMSLGESLTRARAALEVSYQRMVSLHKSWRSQLQRVSVMVLIIVLKQSSIPATNCLQEIQSWNEQITGTGDNSSTNNNKGGGLFGRNKKITNDATVLDESLLIGDWDAVQYCLADSVMEILSVLCCLSLILLMYRSVQGDDFRSLPFRFAVSSVPLIAASYFNNPVVDCLKDLKASIDNDKVAEGGSPRTFPVVLIFLVIAFASLYMMQYEQKQQRENIEKVEKLREDLLGTKKTK